jgi:hypothetical protein
MEGVADTINVTIASFSTSSFRIFVTLSDNDLEGIFEVRLTSHLRTAKKVRSAGELVGCDRGFEPDLAVFHL